MADDAEIGFGDAEEIGGAGAGVLVVEGQDDDGSLTFFQGLDAAGELVAVELRSGRLDGGEHGGAELFEEAIFALRVTAEVEDHHAAGPEDEGDELFGLAEAAGAERFEGRDEDLLGKIVGGGFVAEVTQAVQTYAGREAAE